MVGVAVAASGITSAATLSRAFGGDYLGEFVDVPTTLAALLFIAVVALVNFRGISESIEVNLALTLIELTGLLLIVLIGVAALGRGEGDAGQAFEFKEDTFVPFAIFGGARSPSTRSSASRAPPRSPRSAASRRTTVMLLLSVFTLVNVAVLVLRRERVEHSISSRRGSSRSRAQLFRSPLLIKLIEQQETWVSFLIVVVLLVAAALLWALNRYVFERTEGVDPAKLAP
jgi:Amino acid permease